MRQLSPSETSEAQADQLICSTLSLELGENVIDRGNQHALNTIAAATALNYFAYNFIKIHRTLRMSPAMAAGVTDQLWSVEDLVTLWEAYEQRRAERAA
jgi:hypothetical protein